MDWILSRPYFVSDFVSDYILQLYFVCNHCGMYILLSDDKHQKVWDISKKRTGNLRQIQSKTKCSPRQKSVWEFFPDGREFFFYQTEFCHGMYLSWTEFSLRLNLSRTKLCLGLHTAVVFRMRSFNFLFVFSKTSFLHITDDSNLHRDTYLEFNLHLSVRQ